ncbi:hypothetical protein BC830DRAFT_166770 [Chytriomyces sp. MP71]|nr:hypothetical protein BC830DRAFT_166770 [Chytriomyces sp. MP71]
MTSQPTASALQFLYGIFDGTLTSEEVDAIVGVSPDSRSLDVSVGMEVVLAWLDADFELETASSMSSSSSLDDDGGALSQLKALCPHRDSHTLNRVLSSCGGDVDRAADRLFAATGGSEEDEKTVRVQVKGTSVRGRGLARGVCPRRQS